MLASINRIETAFGTNLNVSTAGAVGWMQFMPATWQAYGVDANGDGRKDPYNPVDAICAAARYLKAAGGDTDLRSAIFAYNHADWYVDEVLLYARQYGKLPADLVGSLTGLTEGDRFPVAAKARYADDISERARRQARQARQGLTGNAADVVSGSPTRRGINIYSHEGAPVVAVNDGTITKIGHNKQLGNYIVLQDDYGNRFTYAQLGRVVEGLPGAEGAQAVGLRLQARHPGEGQARPASRHERQTAERQAGGHADVRATPPSRRPSSEGGLRKRQASARRPPVEHRGRAARALYALPRAPAQRRPRRHHGPARQLLTKQHPRLSSLQVLLRRTSLHFDRGLDGAAAAPEGLAGGRRHGPRPASARRLDLAPHLNFAIQPAGKGAPKIDPKPILDGWKLLEATAIYRAAGKNPFAEGAGTSNVTQDLLMRKAQLQRKVLADPRLSIYACGRNDIQTGQIDRRVLATMEYLADSGFRLTITSLKCGHSLMTTSGNVSASTRPATPWTSRRSTASRCAATRARGRSPTR